MAQETVSRPKHRFGHNFIFHLAAFLCKLLFGIYGRMKVYGLENVPKTGAALLPANHASYLDPLLVGTALYGHRRAWGLARRDLWNNKALAYVLDCLQAYPIRRHTADKETLKLMLRLLSENELVIVFPEGSRTRDGLLHPAQPGIALLAQRSGQPVIPVAIIGNYAMLPTGAKKLKRADLIVIFGKPLVFTRESSREEITETVMRSIAELMTAHGYPTDPPIPDAVSEDVAAGG